MFLLQLLISYLHVMTATFFHNLRLLGVGVTICCLTSQVLAQVVEVLPVFPRLDDDVTITFNAAEGNGALVNIAPVYAHAGLITSTSTHPNDWKYVQGNWGTADPTVLMQSQGNNLHTISYNIRSFHNVPQGEEVLSLAFVFRNASGSVVGRATDGADIFYPVYPNDVGFLSALLTPQVTSLAVEPGAAIRIKGATSLAGELVLLDNGDTIVSTPGTLLDYVMTAADSGNHFVQFVAIREADTLVQSFFYTVIGDVVVADPPPGREDGFTFVDDSTAHFQLYAPGKGIVYLTGSFNNWQLDVDYQLKQSEDGHRWWIEVGGLEPGSDIQYQYVVDGGLRIADPYSTLVLDPFNDGFIGPETYPDMPVYPYGMTTGMITHERLSPVEPLPKMHPKPDKRELIIYEMLLRDFLHAHSYQVLEDTLDYLQRLGVNAIELMPVQEYEGNLSWGYNPAYHMALDKYYGSAEAFRNFIEACHARGIAVILDVVYNHAFGQSPLVQLYWNAVQNRPSADSPWFNQTARHDFNVGFDFNHESPATRYFVKRVLSWWLDTYAIDGFRFDLSKGFTQKNTLGNISAFNAYDQSRIDILQDYATHVWSHDEDAYVILEHFADNNEEIELSSRGMMLWGNMNHAYSQASMSFENSDLSWVSHERRGWSEPHLISYMESHDEERLMYRNLQFGNSVPGYDIREPEIALSRIELVSPFFYLIPGPKMIWQFGELGYDYSINHCPDGTINNNCRLAEKPIRWDYLEDWRRKRVYDITRALILLRNTQAVRDGALEISLASRYEKKLRIRHDDMDLVAVGNFDVNNRNIAPVFTRTGWWFDYFSGDSLFVENQFVTLHFTPGEYHVYTTTKIPLEIDIATSVEDTEMANARLLIYPAINDGRFTVALPYTVSGFIDITVTDLSGRSIYQSKRPTDEFLQVDIPQPPGGIYIVWIRTNEGLFHSKIVIP